MNHSPGGIRIGLRKVQGKLPSQGAMYESFSRTPLRMTWPLMIWMRSPGPPTTRLMNVALDSWDEGVPQAWECPAPWLGSPQKGLWLGSVGVAPAGGWNTTMSPTPGRSNSRLVSTRWPMCSVGSIDPLGILYGLTMNRW